jgi:hypothetical protein
LSSNACGFVRSIFPQLDHPVAGSGPWRTAFHRGLASVLDAGGGIRAALRWSAHHTGLPAIVVAAIALVVSWHLFKGTVRFGLEVLFATIVLAFATHFGLLRW